MNSVRNRKRQHSTTAQEPFLPSPFSESVLRSALQNMNRYMAEAENRYRFEYQNRTIIDLVNREFSGAFALISHRANESLGYRIPDGYEIKIEPNITLVRRS